LDIIDSKKLDFNFWVLLTTKIGYFVLEFIERKNGFLVLGLIESKNGALVLDFIERKWIFSFGPY